LDQLFNHDIFPRGVTAFSSEDLKPNLYNQKREWLEYEDWGSPGDLNRYESWLDKLFWNKKGPDVLCITGDVGVGKSTFLKYYLRCYCPLIHPVVFKRKLILYIDANALPSTGGSRVTNMNHAVQTAVEEACKSRATKMPVTGAKDIIRWVLEAFRVIHDKSKPPGSLFEYAVLFVDNLDQCPPEDQKSIVHQIHSWREQYPNLFWRIIFTLWPGTFKDLNAIDTVFLRSCKELPLGPLLCDCHIDRVDHLRIAVAQSAADRGMSSKDNALDYIEFAINHMSKLAIQFIRKLTNGDLRRELKLCSDFLFNDVIDKCWRSGKPPSQYETIQALLLGKKDALDHDVSRIANILKIGHATEKPRDVLVGWHLSELLNGTITTFTVSLLLIGRKYLLYKLLSANGIHRKEMVDGTTISYPTGRIALGCRGR